MNGCQGNTSACSGVDVKPVKLGLRRVLLLMCEGCRSTTLAIATIVERRVANVPVEVEHRHWRAPWARRNLSRDETGKVVAA